MTRKLSYEGPLRSDSPGWEYVLELDGTNANSQQFSPPFLVGRYGFTFLMPGKSCADYAWEA